MAKNRRVRVLIAAAYVSLAVLSGTVRADEIPLVTGKQWTESSMQLKNAYLLGIANIVQVELAYESGNLPPDSQSVVPRFGKGLRGETLDSVREKVDHWYAAHTDRLQRPVIETIWFEMVIPGLRRN